MVARIKSVTVGKLGRVSGQRASRASSGSPAGVSPAARSDGVEFSPDARAIGRADEVVSKTPDVRMEVITPIREALADGRYHVASLDVADKILRQVLLDRKRSF